MSCQPTVTAQSSVAVVQVASGAPAVIEATSAPVVVEIRQSTVNVEVPTTPALVIEVCKQGPVGPAADLVCVIKPDSTLSYLNTRLDRIDYTDGRFKTFAYAASGLLTTVACVDPGVKTVTKTLGYTGGQLTSVATVVS